jgi:hypothetical protein
MRNNIEKHSKSKKKRLYIYVKKEYYYGPLKKLYILFTAEVTCLSTGVNEDPGGAIGLPFVSLVC